MRICLITNIVSPHQMPLAEAIVRLIGAQDFRYIVTERDSAERAALGWGDAAKPDWLLNAHSGTRAKSEVEHWKSEADVILCGNRDLDCFEQRARAGRITLYMSERWYKPPLGMWRLLHPRACRLALRFYRLLSSPHFFYLPMGRHAADDVLRMAKWIDFLPRRWLGLPRLQTLQVRDKLWLWGYFVEPSRQASRDRSHRSHQASAPALSILWVGRLLKLKHVDTLIRAVIRLLREGLNIRLAIVGQGPEERRLRALAKTYTGGLQADEPDGMEQAASVGMRSTEHPAAKNPAASSEAARHAPAICFHAPVPIERVREWMRQADVYVFPSDGAEGWGAVVNEAMSEGCVVVATRESGAGVTLIADEVNGLLFRLDDAAGLAQRLRRLQANPDFHNLLAAAGERTIRELWCPAIAAQRLVTVCRELVAGRGVPRYTDGPMAPAT